MSFDAKNEIKREATAAEKLQISLQTSKSGYDKVKRSKEQFIPLIKYIDEKEKEKNAERERRKRL